MSDHPNSERFLEKSLHVKSEDKVHFVEDHILLLMGGLPQCTHIFVGSQLLGKLFELQDFTADGLPG